MHSTRPFLFRDYQEIAEHILTIMVDNIEKILERGDRIELLIDKTATTQDSAFHFRKQSKFRRALWMKNLKLLHHSTIMQILVDSSTVHKMNPMNICIGVFQIQIYELEQKN
ncbi:hypothetical protein HN51_002850 [Arachis hypogaea]